MSGVLLAQDIVVVILLAVLAAGRPESAVEVATTLAIVLTLVAIITVAALAASKYALPEVFRRVADNKQIFFLVAISWAFLFVFISDEINLFLSPFGVEAYLSIEMGAFLAGLAIAQLPYSKGLKDRVNPLTDLFVMIFFVSVALSMDASQLLFYWEQAVIAAIVLMIAKFAIFFALINWQRFDSETTFLGSLYMIQVSEFGIVVGVAAFAGDFIDGEILGFLTMVALITMSISVYFIEFGQELFTRFESSIGRLEAEDTFTEDKRKHDGHAVVIGYDDITRNLLSFLDTQFDDVVVVDRRIDHIQQLNDGGYYSVFGDIGSTAIREDVALHKADFVLSSSDQVEIGKILLEDTSDDAIVILEAASAEDAKELYLRGADYVIRSVDLSAERLHAYLVAFLEEPELFNRAIELDTALMRAGDPFPAVHERMEARLDD